MIIPANKNVVCITGSVWSGSHSAPRWLLQKDGFVRPTWFTTGRRIYDAKYVFFSEGKFHLHNSEHEVLAYIKYGRSFMGILKQEIDSVLDKSERGALIVGPQEMAEQVAGAIPGAIVFTLKAKEMELSPHLDKAKQRGQLHRIDVDSLDPGSWSDAYSSIAKKIGIPVRREPF